MRLLNYMQGKRMTIFETGKILEKKNREKKKGRKENLKKKKKYFKLNKLIGCVYLNSFYLFIFVIFGLTNFKIRKHLRNFDFIFFSERPNMGKYFSLNIYIFYFFNRMICDAGTFRKIIKKLKKNL